MMVTIAERLKELRELHQWTQARIAKEIDVTRSSVNAWEMGISLPSISKLIELSCLFGVSTDYLLGLDSEKYIRLTDLSPEEQKILYGLLDYFHGKRNEC